MMAFNTGKICQKMLIFQLKMLKYFFGYEVLALLILVQQEEKYPNIYNIK